MKTCNKCKKEKELFEFGKNKSSKDGLAFYCKNCSKEYMKNYNKINKKEIYSKEKEWRIKNKKRFNDYHNEYHKQKRKNPLYKLHKFITSSIYRGLKLGKKDSSSLEIVGLNSWDDFKTHIEGLFEKGMTWENYGKGKNNEKWHIDHVTPISSAKTLEEIKKLNHYTNLKPMWCSDNIRKRNKP